MHNHQLDIFLNEDALSEIINMVTQRTKVERTDIFSKLRKSKVVRARWLAWYGLYYGLGWSTIEIGITFNKDHSTVVHGLKALAQEAEKNPKIRKICAELIGKLKPESLEDHAITRWLYTQQIDLKKIAPHVNSVLKSIDSVVKPLGLELSLRKVKNK